DRERLQSRLAQPDLSPGSEHPLDPGGALLPRENLEPTRDLMEDDSAFPAFVGLGHFREEPPDFLDAPVPEHLGQDLEPDGHVAREEHGLEDLFRGRHVGHPSSTTIRRRGFSSRHAIQIGPNSCSCATVIRSCFRSSSNPKKAVIFSKRVRKWESTSSNNARFLRPRESRITAIASSRLIGSAVIVWMIGGACRWRTFLRASRSR